MASPSLSTRRSGLISRLFAGAKKLPVSRNVPKVRLSDYKISTFANISKSKHDGKVGTARDFRHPPPRIGVLPIVTSASALDANQAKHPRTAGCDLFRSVRTRSRGHRREVDLDLRSRR